MEGYWDQTVPTAWGLYDPLKKNVVTKESLKKKAKIYNMEKPITETLVISQNKHPSQWPFQVWMIHCAIHLLLMILEVSEKLAVFTDANQIQVDALLVDGYGLKLKHSQL